MRLTPEAVREVITDDSARSRVLPWAAPVQPY